MMKHLKFLMIVLGGEGSKRSKLTSIAIIFISLYFLTNVAYASVSSPTGVSYYENGSTGNQTIYKVVWNDMGTDSVGNPYVYNVYPNGITNPSPSLIGPLYNLNYTLSIGQSMTLCMTTVDTSTTPDTESSCSQTITITNGTGTPPPTSTPTPVPTSTPNGIPAPDAPSNVVYTDLGNGTVHGTWNPASSGSSVSYYDVYVDGVKQNSSPISQTNSYDFTLTNPDSHTLTVVAVGSNGLNSISTTFINNGSGSSTPTPTPTSFPTDSPTPVPTLCPDCVMYTAQEICDICTCINNLQPTLNAINDSTNGVITQLVNLGNQLSSKIDQQISATDQVRLGIEDLKNQLLGQITPTQDYPLPTVRPLPLLSDNKPPMVNGVFTDNTTYFTDQGDAPSPASFPVAPNPTLSWNDTKGGLKYRENPMIKEQPKIRTPVYTKSIPFTKSIPDIKTPPLTKSVPLTRSVPLTKSIKPTLFPKMVRQPTPPPMEIINGNQLRWNSNQYP
jgi:hypothetical protein